MIQTWEPVAWRAGDSLVERDRSGIWVALPAYRDSAGEIHYKQMSQHRTADAAKEACQTAVKEEVMIESPRNEAVGAGCRVVSVSDAEVAAAIREIEAERLTAILTLHDREGFPNLWTVGRWTLNNEGEARGEADNLPAALLAYREAAKVGVKNRERPEVRTDWLRSLKSATDEELAAESLRRYPPSKSATCNSWDMAWARSVVSAYERGVTEGGAESRDQEREEIAKIVDALAEDARSCLSLESPPPNPNEPKHAVVYMRLIRLAEEIRSRAVRVME